MQERGLIVKLKNKTCIVLTPQGEYREVPLPGNGPVRAGQEIRLEKKEFRPYLNLKHFVAAALLLVFVLAWQLYPGRVPAAAAYLTIDINPSMELAVSAGRKVVSASALNGDGEKILSKVAVRGRMVDEAVEAIVARAVAENYLAKGSDNVILATLTVAENAEPVADLVSICEAIKKPLDSGGVDAEVIIEPVRPELRQEAASSGLSTGRYLLLQKSGKKGVPVSIGEISTKSLGELEKEKKFSIADLLAESGAETERENSAIKGEGREKAGGKGIYMRRSKANDNQDDNWKGEEKAFAPGKVRQTGKDEAGRSPEPAGGIKRREEEKKDDPVNRDKKGKAKDEDRLE
ncbi:MAG: anti-sigma factor domain-containing protein [Pelotomaculum sp.]|nr:anti-sigma factor domain-containing protein [Pelotomaculum sp.]